MSDKPTPTTEEVRNTYQWGAQACGCCATYEPEDGEEFDRWLREARAKAVTDFALVYLPTDLYRKAQEHANNIREGGERG